MERLSLYALATLFIASACATGESLGDVGSDFVDDGGPDSSVHQGTGGISGSGGGAELGSGGTTESGGAENAGTGSTVSSGGSGAVSAGGGGGTSTGGKASSGGAKSTGGATGKGGTVADAGGDAGPACITGQKECATDHTCWPPNPAHGCDFGPACTPCPAPPANGYAKCTANACDFDCLGGYTKSGNTCISGGGGAGGGGTGGGNGAGGAKACVPKDCGGCQAFVTGGCCKGDGTCGCSLIWVPGSACK